MIVASFYFSNTEEEQKILIHLPRLKGVFRDGFLSVDALPPQRRALLWRKLLICGIRFDFTREGEEVYRDIKRSTLVELMDASESMGYVLVLRLIVVHYSMTPSACKTH